MGLPSQENADIEPCLKTVCKQRTQIWPRKLT